MALFSLTLSFFLFSKVSGQSKTLEISYTDDKSVAGFRTKIFSDDGEPVIAFGNSKDAQHRVYCLQFTGFYEALNYDITTGQKTKISNSEIEFDDDINNWQFIDQKNRSFIIKTTDRNTKSDLLEFVFGFENIDGASYGLKFEFILNNYQWTSWDPKAEFVLTLELRYCPDFSVSSSDSFDDDENDWDRRRNMEINNNNNDDDSSDSYDEYSLDVAIFRNIPTAIKYCGIKAPMTNVSVGMYEKMDDDKVEIELIYSNFNGCNLKQDPYVFVDTSGFKEGLDAWEIVLIVVGSLVVVGILAWIVKKKMKARNDENEDGIPLTQNNNDNNIDNKDNKNETNNYGTQITAPQKHTYV